MGIEMRKGRVAIYIGVSRASLLRKGAFEHRSEAERESL